MATRVAPSTEADRAVDTSERVRYLRKEMGLSETDLSDATGASTRTVRRWLAGDVERQRPQFAQQIDDLRAIVDELTESLTAKGIRQWLHSRNRYLRGARPIDMLREGEFEKVREAAHAFNEGYYL